MRLARWQRASRTEEREAIELASALQLRAENVQDRKASVERTFISRYQMRFEAFSKKNLLEIGNSVGGFLRWIDISSLNVEIDPLNLRLREWLKRRTILSDLHTVNGIAETMPFKDDSFDIVVCSNTLDHCIDMRAALHEIHRVLRPEGILLLSVNTFNLPRFTLHLLRPIFHTFDRPHPHHISHATPLKLLRGCSFNVVHHWIEPFCGFEASKCIKFLIGARIYGRLPKNVASLFLRRGCSHLKCAIAF